MSRSSSRKELRKQRAQQIEQVNQPQTKTEVLEQLFVGGLKIKRKHLEEFNNQYKQAKTLRKRSFKFLADPLQTIVQKEKAKHTPIRKTSQEAKIKTNKITKQNSRKQLTKQDEGQTCEVSHKTRGLDRKEKETNPSQEKQIVQHEFVEKKMKIGNRGKSDAMKQFIIETLLKGKAEGNSLTIHKGTAQCTQSPRRDFNQSQIANASKQKYSLVLVQQKSKSVAPKRKSLLPPLPQNQLKPSQRAESKNVINVPSSAQNKKFLAIAKKMQKKEAKKGLTIQLTKPQQEEVIQENIVEQNTSEVMHIPQQIQE